MSTGGIEQLSIIVDPLLETRGRRALKHTGRMTDVEYQRRSRAHKKQQRVENIAILDTETDPFDPDTRAMICPFLAVLYSDNFDPVVIWEEERDAFARKVVEAISALPDRYTIYAHNGGKFDYMFFIHLIRGTIKFKGRGIMSCRIGRHELRDSLHIIPEKLAAWKKDHFDYSRMRTDQRDTYRREIIAYCISDCRYLLEIVRAFVERYGFKLSIGQAAQAALRQHYKVKTIGEFTDAALRPYFFGGRVECIRGRGRFVGEYKLYDVNAMYSKVMAFYKHPVSNEYVMRVGEPNERTVFIDLECYNRGALIGKAIDGGAPETSANISHGRFLTTIHEYEVARKYNLISNVRILHCIDNMELSDFSKFVLPTYENRQKAKADMLVLTEGSAAYEEAKKDDFFFKYLLNNAYGKFAQNPRRYKESYITDPGDFPVFETKQGTVERDVQYGSLPSYESFRYWIWEKPQEKLRFNNVGTAASITGAARSVLLDAIQNAHDPIYCDTDSLICKSLRNVELSETTLGAWKLEKTFSEVLITGKKQYAARRSDVPVGSSKELVLKSKGVSGLKWDDYLQMLNGTIVHTINKAPTLTKRGDQFYMRRAVRATAPQFTDENRIAL